MMRAARDIGGEGRLVGEQDALPVMGEPTGSTRRDRGNLHSTAL
jgi:hypothetical protein